MARNLDAQIYESLFERIVEEPELLDDIPSGTLERVLFILDSAMRDRDYSELDFTDEE